MARKVLLGVAAVAVIVAAVFFAFVIGPSGVALGQALDNSEKADTLRLGFRRGETKLEFWRTSKPERSRWDDLAGNYRIADGDSLQVDRPEDVGSQAPRGGPVATAGGLLFVGTAGDRTFRARDAATGRVLWEYKLDAGTEGVPAVYEVNGRQYVTLPVGGDGLFAQRGNPAPGPSKYITFALPAR